MRSRSRSLIWQTGLYRKMDDRNGALEHNAVGTAAWSRLTTYPIVKWRLSFVLKKYRIRETPNISTDADSSTNIFFFTRRLQVMDLFRVLMNGTEF